MSTDTKPAATSGQGVSADVWAVLIAFVLALAVKFDLLKNIPW
jgi:hypothetical protein